MSPVTSTETAQEPAAVSLNEKCAVGACAAAALWAKAMALDKGDEEKSRYRYIALWVKELSKASAAAPPEGSAPIIDSGDEGLRSKTDNSASQTPHPATFGDWDDGASVAPEDNTPSAAPSTNPTSQADNKPIPEGWIPLTGDKVNERIAKIQRGKEAGFISDGIWYELSSKDRILGKHSTAVGYSSPNEGKGGAVGRVARGGHVRGSQD